MGASAQEQIAYLSDFLTDRRKILINDILEQRTDSITIILEDVYHAQNISAAIRTSECFGIQDIHIIERIHQYQVNPRIVRGAAKWVTMHHYHPDNYSDPSSACIDQLKNEGFTIYATSPDAAALPMDEIKFDPKSAFIFGTELSGISDSASLLADHLIRIPMSGFTESFNISVSVALILQRVKSQMQKSSLDLSISEKRKEKLRLDWYKKTVRHSDHLLALLDKK